MGKVPHGLTGMKNKNKIVKSLIADYTFREHLDYGFGFDNEGASGEVILQLPEANLVGIKVAAYVKEAQYLQLKPAAADKVDAVDFPLATDVSNPDITELAAGKYIRSNTPGAKVVLECTEIGKWSISEFVGHWAAEA